ncbi:M42 family metallopeptidase [Thermovenabulum sp.]|uniref:M42 family metallopeptidase n=1 Tax=Thermovenabulum sp. TaxID=3100335 RepID=UPI003C7B545E
MLLKRLSEAAGVSGNENEVRDILREELKGYAEIRTDALGNLIFEKKNKSKRPKIMLAAHMDEVGLMITSILKNGFLKFETVGGIDERVLVSKIVTIGPNKVFGVIGAKPIHRQEPKERENALKIKNLYIDIGAKDQEDAEKKVKIGDYACFNTEFEIYGDSIVKGKALDDRIGCFVVAEIIKRNYEVEISGAFTVQEEVGLRGSGVAAYQLKPDVCIVAEGTFASDVPGMKEEEYNTLLGRGPAITTMDRSFIADKRLRDRVFEIAKKNNIVCQPRRTNLGGTDAGRIQSIEEGIPTIVISVPTRYIHSPVSIADLNDINNTISLVDALINDFQERGI